MSIPTYATWRQVPDHLALESQLATLDLPRAVGGPVRGWIEMRNAIGRMESFALYDLRESVPTPGSAAALEAAAARRTRVYECDGCGARTEAALGVHDPCHHRDHPGRRKPCEHRGRRCAACRQAAELAHAARTAATARNAAAAWAAGMLAADALVVRVSALHPTPAVVNGRRRPALGWRINAIDAIGIALPLPAIARASVKAAGLPERAVDGALGAMMLHTFLGGRTVVAYQDEEVAQLRRLLAAVGADDARAARLSSPGIDQMDPDAEPAPPPVFAAPLATKLADWRGLIDPRTATLLPPLDPGPADRCALLLRRMAAIIPPE